MESRQLKRKSYGFEIEKEFYKKANEWINGLEDEQERELKEKFSVQTNVELKWTYALGEIKITEIIVKTENGEGNTAMWEYLTKNYCSEVMIE